jgi:acetyl-CoA C-acetyltransferase
MQRACGTGLETIMNIANKIALSQIDSGIGGGVDSISDAPIVYNDNLRKILLKSFTGKSLKEKLTPWSRMRTKTIKTKITWCQRAQNRFIHGRKYRNYCKRLCNLSS